MSDGLFDDLEELPHEEIEDKVKQLERDLRSLDDEFNSLRQDRRSQVDIVKSLRGAVGGIEEANSERRNLLREFHEIKKKADKKEIIDESTIYPTSGFCVRRMDDRHTL